MKYWAEAPLWYLVLLGLVIPLGLPIGLNQFAVDYWLSVAITALPMLIYLGLMLSYRPNKHNRVLAWLDDPFNQGVNKQKAGLGVAIAITVGLAAQTLSLIAVLIWLG
ncbi:hypothetical protein JYB87_02735 [Shewanella avicenniae]|uniref:CPBP family intramembrane metalloprotease n=1 Tax=Shewanella avicenniae TaxID=2814294 RepID=A0ABX7QRV7_9GAMM|nr:hypothetical protein [Shewanella avicenniae]QSX34182.1 hypothetical protein JYB87_02735 [Shewanella avicenniae]